MYKKTLPLAPARRKEGIDYFKTKKKEFIMAEVISVRFRGGAKNYYFDPRGLQVEPGQYVVVETAQGMEYVCCVEGNHEVPE